MEFHEVVAHRADGAPFRARAGRFAPCSPRAGLTAQRAPSAGFSQGQRLLVVTDPELRQRVAQNCSERYYVEHGFGPWISEAPALFIPCVSEAIYRARYQEPDKVADEAAYHASTASRPTPMTMTTTGPSRTGGWHRLHRDARPAGGRR